MPPKKSKKAKAAAAVKREEEAASNKAKDDKQPVVEAEEPVHEIPAEEDELEGGAGDTKPKSKVKKEEVAAAKEETKEETAKEDDEKKEGDDDDVKQEGNGGKKDEDKKDDDDNDVKDEDTDKLARKRKTSDSSPSKQPESASGSPRSKRSRKLSQPESYQPENFKKTTHSAPLSRGRGKKLKDIDSVKESVEQFSMNSEEMVMAHKFLYTMRGRVPRRDMKTNVLEFSGFLKYMPEDADEKGFEEDDEEAEVRQTTQKLEGYIQVGLATVLAQMLFQEFHSSLITHHLLAPLVLVLRLFKTDQVCDQGVQTAKKRYYNALRFL
jgi:hypothetical protein